MQHRMNQEVLIDSVGEISEAEFAEVLTNADLLVRKALEALRFAQLESAGLRKSPIESLMYSWQQHGST